MRRLTQKELATEGIGSFLKNVGKGAAVVAGKALKGVAKAASPTAYGLAKQSGQAFKDTDQAVRAATTSPEGRITDYFRKMGYKVVSGGINPGMSDNTKVVKVSEIVYDDQGAGKEVPVPSPFVVKVDKSGVKVIRGPRQRNTSSAAQMKKNKEATQAADTQAQTAKPATKLAESIKSQKNLLKHLHYGSQMNK